MDNNNQLAENLLKADGIDPSRITESERVAFREMLNLEQKRLKRLSWLHVGILWIFCIALLGLSFSENLLEKLHIPFAVSGIALVTAMVVVMIKWEPGHIDRLEETNKKVSKLYYLVHGRHRGITLISKKGNQRIIRWPRLIVFTVILWLVMSLGGAGIYYIMCRRWIYAEHSEAMWVHVFMTVFMPLAFLTGTLKQGLKGPLEELVEIESQPSKSARRTDMSRNIFHRRMITFAVAAVSFIMIAIGVFYHQQNQQIQIPPELAQMPVEHLLEIHQDLAKSPYEQNLVTAALKNSLDKISAREVLAISKGNNRPAFAPDTAVYVPKPASETVEAADLLVCGWVNKVELDVSDLKEAILIKQDPQLIEHFSSVVPAEIELNVLDVYPSGAVHKGENLILRPVLNARTLNLIQKDHEYLLLLYQKGEMIWIQPYQEGVYPVDVETGLVSGFRGGPIQLKEAWQMTRSIFKVLHEEQPPSREELEYRVAKLQSNDFADCWLGLEYLSTLKKVPDITKLILNCIEKYHSVQVNYMQGNNQRPEYNAKEVDTHAALITDAINLLIYMNDRPSIEKVISLSEQNVSADSVFNKSLFKYQTQNVQAVLNEAAHHEPNSEIEPIESREVRIQENKEKIAEAIETYQQDPSESNLSRVFNLMRDYLRPEDKEFIPFLKQHVTSHWTGPSLVARLGDPVFIPVLLDALETEMSGGLPAGLQTEMCSGLLEALFACGQQQKAIDVGGAELLAPVVITDWDQFDIDLRRRKPIISFLGTCGDISVLPAIEYYLDENILEDLYQTNKSLHGSNTFSIDQLQQTAVLALARLEGTPAIPKLQKLYASNDIHIRILAALSLYYLGDDTGYELLEHFVKNTHRSVPEIEARWHYDLAGHAFKPAMKYLTSPRIDALILERMRYGLDHHTIYYLCSQSFVDTYEAQILRILVDQLSSKDRSTREGAYLMLKELTSMDFRFNPDRFSGQQEDEIDVWRNSIEQYLSETL